LPEDLITDAADKVGSEHLDYDKHLQDIVRDKRYWENKRQQIRIKEKKLEELVLKYESEMAEINKQKKEITQKAKAEAQQLLSEANAKIENTIRQIKEAQADKEKTKLIRKELQDFKDKVNVNPEAEVRKPKIILQNRQKTVPVKEDKPVFTTGMQVRLKNQSATGTILELQDKNALVAFGQLKSTVKLSQLEFISNNQLKKENRKLHAADTVTEEVRQRKLNFKSEIDVRGMRGDEALQAVMYFVDDALMVGVSSVRILHGTGTGALRQLIRQYLGTVHGVKSARDEHVQFGGAGITIVELD